MAKLMQLICGSAHHVPQIASGSVHLVCFSPPYWGLRAYAGEQGVEWPEVAYAPMPGLPPITIPGCDLDCEHEWGDVPPRKPGQVEQTKWKQAEGAGRGQTAAQGAYCARCGGWRGGLGLEPTIEMYIGHLMLVLREMRRVLRDDGTCWVNLGDTYFGGKGKSGYELPHEAEDRRAAGKTIQRARNVPGYASARPADMPQVGIKPKDLCLIPQRFALAAQADGWWIRGDIVWAKKNPLPESVTDRPNRSHETIWMLAKSKTYFYDHIAVRQEAAAASLARVQQKTFATQRGGKKNYGSNGVNGNRSARKTLENFAANPGRNLRDVWHLATQPTKEAHFATYPEALVEIMIRAGSSEKGCCPQCGAPWKRITQKGMTAHDGTTDSQYEGGTTANRLAKLRQAARERGEEYVNRVETVGWQPTCVHTDDPVPCVILDPFVGSGTTAIVAIRLGRRCIGIDISSEYLENILPKRLGSAIQMRLV